MSQVLSVFFLPIKMPKTCQATDCKNNVWGKGFCPYHQWMRTDKKPKPFKPRNKKTGELQLFYEIWDEREHVSFLTGRTINEKPGSLRFVNCFGHILNKKNYPKFRLKKENIVLLDPEEHYLLDFGSEVQRQEYEFRNDCDFGRIEELKEELLNEYKEL